MSEPTRDPLTEALAEAVCEHVTADLPSAERLATALASVARDVVLGQVTAILRQYSLELAASIVEHELGGRKP